LALDTNCVMSKLAILNGAGGQVAPEAP